jgi:hypothetical protein
MVTKKTYKCCEGRKAVENKPSRIRHNIEKKIGPPAIDAENIIPRNKSRYESWVNIFLSRNPIPAILCP